VTRAPRWLKLSYTGFVALLVPFYWLEYGWQNFLWACDIALLVTLYALWGESRLAASSAALATLLPDSAWSLDYLVRLLAGHDLLRMDATAYMFDATIPPYVRALSLFHVFLPPLLLWLVLRLGYDRRAIVLTTMIAWVVLPLSYAVSDRAQNINWVFGFGVPPSPVVAGFGQVLMLMLLAPLLVYLPTHLVLGGLCREKPKVL
jgi:hypothetical protein